MLEDFEMTVKPQSPRAMRLFTHGLLCSSALLLVSACSEPLDFDLRGNFGKAPSTAAAARQAVGGGLPDLAASGGSFEGAERLFE